MVIKRASCAHPDLAPVFTADVNSVAVVAILVAPIAAAEDGRSSYL